jgi:hypothetical protein
MCCKLHINAADDEWCIVLIYLMLKQMLKCCRSHDIMAFLSIFEGIALSGKSA